MRGSAQDLDQFDEQSWTRVAEVETLTSEKPLAIQLGANRLAMFRTASDVFACDDRCPHQGYPLSELGSIEDSCHLTCAMHNWRYDLRTGESRFGGNRLRVWPTRIHKGGIWVRNQPWSVGELAHAT